MSRRRGAVLLICGLLAAFLPSLGGTWAGGVGSPAEECADNDFVGAIGVKYEFDEEEWEGDPAIFSTITLTITQPAADWSSTGTVLGVLVKGSTETAVYNYVTDPGLPKTGLTTPEEADGKLHDISHVTFCLPGGGPGPDPDPDPDPDPEALLPLGVDLEAAGSYTQTWSWTIDKTATRTWIARSGASSPLEYSIDVTKTGYQLSAQVLGGTVTIVNPNDDDVTVTDLDVVDASCTLTQPTAVAPGETDVSFTCDITAKQEVDDLPEELSATVAWADPNATEATEATDTVAVDYEVTEVNASVSVVDAVDGQSSHELGTTSTSKTFPDAVTVATPAVEGCRTVENTATIVETGASDSASVEVCRQAFTKGGFTIGFWHNKNGQSIIRNQASTLCSTLATYDFVFLTTPLPVACNSTTLPAWVSSILKGASSKDATLMFKAQFLGTALNVATDTANHLGETDVPVNGSLVGQTGVTCLTVGDLLESADASYQTLAVRRAEMLTVKDWFDAVNNNVMPVCP